MGKVKRTIRRSQEPDTVTLFSAFDEFIVEKEAKNISQPTLVNYKYSFTTFCNFHNFDEETPISEISPNHFYKWINTIKLQGVSHNSINHYLRDVRCFFYWCMNKDRLYIDKPFKIEMIRGQEETVKHYTDEEIERMLEKPKRSEDFVVWRTYAIVNWVLATGSRAATICDVQIGDVDFKRKEIMFRHTKNKKAQIIPLSSSLATVLKEYMKLWRFDCHEDEWLFPNIGEGKLTTNAIRKGYVKYCNSRGVDKTNIHGLRHNFAKRWLENGGNMFKLQKILGHSTLDMTRRYVRLFAEDIKDDFDEFSPLDTFKKGQKRTKTIKKTDDEE
jgi:integrase/recombinase XerD